MVSIRVMFSTIFNLGLAIFNFNNILLDKLFALLIEVYYCLAYIIELFNGLFDIFWLFQDSFESSALTKSSANTSRLEDSNNNRKINEKSSSCACCICQDLISDILLLPCKHVCICSQCFQDANLNVLTRVKNCPICRNRFRQSLKIFN